jgi:hypothetical protein
VAITRASFSRRPAVGNLHQVLGAVPDSARHTVTIAAREGFLAGVNDVLTLGALLSFAGAVLALWLVCEREIRQPTEPEEKGISEGVSEPALA